MIILAVSSCLTHRSLSPKIDSVFVIPLDSIIALINSPVQGPDRDERRGDGGRGQQFDIVKRGCNTT